MNRDNSSSHPPRPDEPEHQPAGAGRRSALWAVGAVAVTAGAAGFLWSSMGQRPGSPASAPAGAPAIGRVGPEFWEAGLLAPDGSPLPLSQWQGKPLLLNFWATWCPPCVKEMPLLDRFHQRWSAQGLTVVGLAVDAPAPVRAFLEKTPVSFPIAMAAATGTDLSRQWGNRQGGLPFSVLVDPGSQILERHVGEINPTTLDAWARRLGLST